MLRRLNRKHRSPPQWRRGGQAGAGRFEQFRRGVALGPGIEPVAGRALGRRVRLVKNMESFCSLYDFLSQIIPFGDSVLETPVTAQGSGLARDRKQALLSEIVEQMNEIFEGELSDADVITYAEGIRDKALEDREVTLQARNNSSLDQFANGKIKQVMSDSETMKRFALRAPARGNHPHGV